jgi:hypothetical protein
VVVHWYTKHNSGEIVNEETSDEEPDSDEEVCQRAIKNPTKTFKALIKN